MLAEQQLMSPLMSLMEGGISILSESGASRRSAARGPQWREKQHYCPKCQRGFTLKSNRNRHAKYECGFEPRYKCPYCDLRSKQTSQVYSHIRKKHPGEPVCVVNVEATSSAE